VISAKKGVGVEGLEKMILRYLPQGPPYFPKDQLSDQPERFFVAEIIREQLYHTYAQEVPYATEVEITGFKLDGQMLRIDATLHVERDSQKGILIGKGGLMLKKAGSYARQFLEEMFGTKVFLKLEVKVSPDWRAKPNMLRQFGYEQED
jgi:GTP-binding protein Era